MNPGTLGYILVIEVLKTKDLPANAEQASVSYLFSFTSLLISTEEKKGMNLQVFGQEISKTAGSPPTAVLHLWTHRSFTLISWKPMDHRNVYLREF